MNKHELKSLLENIYTALTEEGEWHPPLLSPPDPYPIPMAPPPPWLSPLSPTPPVAPPKPPVDDPDEEELDPNDPSTYELQIKQLLEDWESTLQLLDMTPIDAQSKAARDLVNREFQAELDRLQRLIRERDQGGPVG